MSASRTPGAAASVFVGGVAGIVAGVWLARMIRPDLLLDPDPAWAVPRALLGIALAAVVVSVAGASAGFFLLWSRTRVATEPLAAIPLRRSVLWTLGAAAIFVGALVRFVALDRIPWPVFIDEASLIAPALQLEGRPCDFRDSIRPAPYRTGAFTMVGVLFLEGYRVVLRHWAATVFAVRFPAFLTAALSLATAAALGRALLPRGGGTLAALTLSGLRWHLNLSRWAWCPTTVMLTTDGGTLLLLYARRRDRGLLAAIAGFVVGLGAHVYLSAWVAAVALGCFAAWPSSTGAKAPRIRLGLGYALGFGLAVLPLFLFREGRVLPYFSRVSDHNVLREVRSSRSVMPIFATAADAVAAPWFVADPTARHDLPNKSRLGAALGIALAVLFGRALLTLRQELSALLFLHGAFAMAASVAAGRALNPDGLRYGYLSTLTAVAVSGGILAILAAVPTSRRRLAAVAAIGVLIVCGAIGVRDSFRWARDPRTFADFHGQDTLVGRAALRWEAYGSVRVAAGLPHDPITVYVIRRYRLDTDEGVIARAPPDFWVSREATRAFRIEPPETPPAPGERLVERIHDSWGKPWAVVLARKT